MELCCSANGDSSYQCEIVNYTEHETLSPAASWLIDCEFGYYKLQFTILLELFFNIKCISVLLYYISLMQLELQ